MDFLVFYENLMYSWLNLKTIESYLMKSTTNFSWPSYLQDNDLIRRDNDQFLDTLWQHWYRMLFLKLYVVKVNMNSFMQLGFASNTEQTAG